MYSCTHSLYVCLYCCIDYFEGIDSKVKAALTKQYNE